MMLKTIQDWGELFHMKQTEILDLAMERIIDKMREPGVSEEEHKELNQKLKELANLFVIADREERKQDTYIGQSLKRLRKASRSV